MAILKRNKSSVHGLVTDLENINLAIAAETLARETQIGDLEALSTEEKSSLVLAVNEVLSTANSSVGSLKVAGNLSDLEDVAAARANLEVLSAAEVATAISVAQVELGTNFTVADNAERDLLEGLDTGDRVMVLDADESGKWAIFAPTTILEGTVTVWTKLYDQDVLTNSLTAEGIKLAYESLENTNAFTDDEKLRVAAALTTAELAQEVDAESPTAETDVASVAAVAAYVADNAPVIKQVVAIKENLVVAGSTITLSQTPKNAINGILNFGTVRYIDNDGIAYDAPLVATAEPTEFTISTDSADQWTGNSVQVQYLYEV